MALIIGWRSRKHLRTYGHVPLYTPRGCSHCENLAAIWVRSDADAEDV